MALRPQSLPQLLVQGTSYPPILTPFFITTLTNTPQYNFVLSAALSAAIAISAVAQFFSVQWTNTSVNWWGNTVVAQGCESEPCLLKPLPTGGRFYPWWDTDAVPAP